MGFFLSLLYIVTYYLTPATIFGPLAEYRVELILAFLLTLTSLPSLQGSIIWKTPQTLALIGFAIATAMSILVAMHWVSGALEAFLGFLPCTFAFFLVCLHCKTRNRLQILVLTLLFICLFIIAHGYGELMRGVPDDAFQNPEYARHSYLMTMKNETGTLFYRLKGLGEIDDPNDFGQVLVSSIPLIFILWRPKKNLRNAAFVLLPVSLMLFGTYLTHSRGALLALVAIVIVATRRRIGTVPALVIGVGFFAASMALHFSGGREISAEAGSDRTTLWSDGLQILKTHPLFGVGIGKFVDNCDGCGHTAHNSLVVCAAELGSFGLFFWCMFLFPTMRDALLLASPKKVSESEPGASVEEPFPLLRGSREIIDKAEVNRLGRLLVLSLTGFFVTGWFLSRAYVLTLFFLGGMVAVVYEMALSRGMVPPRLPLVRTALYAAALAAALVLLMYILLRTVNFMH
jgi:hypothetical protein